MNRMFIDVRSYKCHDSDWDNARQCYTAQFNSFEKDHVKRHSVRLDEIVDVCHDCEVIMLSNHSSVTYHTVKVRTPSSSGFNGDSCSLLVSNESYGRICATLGIVTPLDIK